MPHPLPIRRLFPGLLLGALGLLFSLPGSAQGSWQARATPTYAYPDLIGCATFTIDSIAYLAGGFSVLGPEGSCHELWAYNPRTDTWSQKADLYSTGRPAAFVLDHKGYVTLGMGASFAVGGVWYPTDMYAYDPVVNQWTPRAPFPAPGRHFPACFVIGNLAYVGLGSSTGPATGHTDWYAYDPVSDSWSAKASFPGQNHAASASFTIGGMGYVAGGVDGNTGTPSAQVWRYDPVADAWTRKNDLPAPRAAPGCFLLQGDAYVMGGFLSLTQTTATTYNSLLKYQPATDSWRPQAPLGTQGRMSPIAFAVGQYAYVGGGEASRPWSVISDFWRYSTALQSAAADQPAGPVSLWPNPTPGPLHLRGLESPAALYDRQGRLIRTLRPGQATADLTDLPPGVYTLQGPGLTRRVVRD